MGKIRGEGFNKEKCACLGAFVLLAFMAVLLALARFAPEEHVVAVYTGVFGSAPPKVLAVPAPVTAMPYPVAYQEQAVPPLPSLAALGDRIRKTPFAPSQYKLDRIAEPTPRPNVTVPLPPPPVIPKPQPPVATQPQRPSAPKDKELEVAYMGVMQVMGETYGLLRAKDGSFRRVKVGEKVADFDYTITRIEKQAVYVKTDEGRVYMLKNDLFSDEGSSGGGPSGQDNLPSFTDPKNAPAPKAHPPTTKPVAPATQNRAPGRPQGRTRPQE